MMDAWVFYLLFGVVSILIIWGVCGLYGITLISKGNTG